jgi:DNA (cytosine-5)-methyltransferase 1
MTIIELFAGAGGASLGIQDAALNPDDTVRVEYDADACATLRHNGLPVVEADVRTIDFSELEGTVSLLWASPPCQSWSTAGSRKGAYEADRNGFPWVFDIIDETKPTWLVVENVPGLQIHRKKLNQKPFEHDHEHGEPTKCPGCYYERVVLPEIAKRFAWSDVWVVNAYEHGVPQKRKRVFMVAGPAPRTAPAPTHGKPGDKGLEPWVTLAQALNLDETELVIGGGSNPRTKGATDRTYRDLTDEPSVAMAAQEVGNRGPWVAPKPEWWHRGTDPLQPSRTIGTKANASITLPEGRRRLTIHECAIVQGFPADYEFCGSSRKSKYRQVGNAVPPKMAEVVVRSLLLQCDKCGREGETAHTCPFAAEIHCDYDHCTCCASCQTLCSDEI